MTRSVETRYFWFTVVYAGGESLPSADEQSLALAWAIVLAVVAWSYLWKCLAFWKAARREQIGWYVVIALAPPFGLVEMLYVFLVAPRVPEAGEGPL